MVAINKTLFSIFGLLVACTTVSAQQIEARIAGLESNAQYMSLLSRDHKIAEREDSISLIVESLRAEFRSAPSESLGENRELIISLENQLFELRASKALIVDSLNLIEQDWVLNNINKPQAEPLQEETELIVTQSDAKYIYESTNVIDNLSSVDYKNLVKAESLESVAEELSEKYVINYDNMLSLRRSYESTSSQSEAAAIQERFDSLTRANLNLSDRLGETWGFIYDNKSFAYSMLMEMMGFNDVLQQEAELMRSSQAEISSKISESSASSELVYYMIQKSSMVQFELSVARKLGLSRVSDELVALSRKLKSIEVNPLKEIALAERSFILYEPIKYVTKPYYNGSNPIPETVVYDKGVIFRIFVGSFQTKPAVSIFRNTTPISHKLNEQRRHCYYIGGFETYEEALEAKAELKRHGFRAPKVVVWSDGKERNLSTDPLEIEPTTYRVEISDVAALPEGAAEVVENVAAGSVVAKVATDKFVITSLERASQADSLVSGLRALDPQLRVVVEKSEPKIEF